jgi:hypothetical protein
MTEQKTVVLHGRPDRVYRYAPPLTGMTWP